MRTETCVGVDVGGTLTKAVLVEPSGAVTRQVVLPTAGVVSTVVEAVGLVGGDPASIGVVVPGIVDRATGTVSGAVNLGLVSGSLALAGALESRLGLPCTLENDTNAAALAASVRCGRPDLALLSVGTGLAAGIVLAGRVWRGGRGGAGELGHLPFGVAGTACACGDRGCLEATASGGAVDRRSGRTVSELLATDPASAAEFLDCLARAVEVLILVLDVDVLLTGGGTSPELLGLVRSRLAVRSTQSGFRRSLDLPGRVDLATSDVPLGAYGAALLARHA